MIIPGLIVKWERHLVIDSEATGLKMMAARKRKGWSLRAMARVMGYSAPYISDLEKGRRGWSHPLALRYGNALRQTFQHPLNPATKPKASPKPGSIQPRL